MTFAKICAICVQKTLIGQSHFNLVVIGCDKAPKSYDHAVDEVNIAMISCDNAPKKCVNAVIW